MLEALLCLKLGETGVILFANELFTLECTKNLKLIFAEILDSVLCKN